MNCNENVVLIIYQIESQIKSMNLETHFLDVTSPDHPMILSREESSPTITEKTLVMPQAEQVDKFK